MEPVKSLRRTFPHVEDMAAAPAAVFPLFCPVREYDWIEGWSCELLHTDSGIAEKGCVFRTDSPSGSGRMTWVVSRYEPTQHIEFACVATDGLVQRLLIAVAPREVGTRVSWTREYTATGPEGEAWLGALREEDVRARTRKLFDRLAHYLRTGTKLP